MWPFRLLILLTVIFVVNGQPLWAYSEDIDALTGEGQLFTEGYASRYYGENFTWSQEKDIKGIREGPVFLGPSAKPRAAWRAHGSISTAAVYDTNPSGTYNDPDGEFTHSYNASWGLSRRQHKTYLAAFYQIGASRFIESEKSNFVSHNQRTEFRWKGNKFRMEFTNSFTPATSFATGERTELETAGRKRVHTWADNATLTLHYLPSAKTDITVSPGWDMLYFPALENSEAVNGFSTRSYRVKSAISYKWRPKTSVHANYLWEYADFFETGGELNAVNQVPTIGITTRLGSKIGIGLDAGLHMREYDETTPTSTGLYLGTGIYRQLTPKIGGSFYYTRDTTQDFDAIQSQTFEQVANFFGTTLNWQLSSRMRLEADASLGLNAKEGEIALADIENPRAIYTRGQDDAIITWGVTWRWKPRRFMDVLLGYKYTNKNSTFKDFEYEQHKIAASASSKF